MLARLSLAEEASKTWRQETRKGMSLPQHLEEAVTRLKEAAVRIKQARDSPFTVDTQRDWLLALTQYAHALCDIQEFNNESVHEKLHELASRLGLREFPSSRPERRA
jgi:hypothetical protein